MRTAIRTQEFASVRRIRRESPENLSKVGKWMQENPNGIFQIINRRAVNKQELLKNMMENTDPFDRIIIAQSIAEKIPLVSSDKKFPKYRKIGLDFIPNY